MRAVFYAKDGMEFDNRWDCEFYEEFLNHPALKGIIFQDGAFEEYQIENYKDILDDSTCRNSWYVIVHNEEEVSDLQWLALWYDWIEWEQITSPGMWKRTVVEETQEGKWVVQNGETK